MHRDLFHCSTGALSPRLAPYVHVLTPPPHALLQALMHASEMARVQAQVSRLQSQLAAEQEAGQAEAGRLQEQLGAMAAQVQQAQQQLQQAEAVRVAAEQEAARKLGAMAAEAASAAALQQELAASKEAAKRLQAELQEVLLLQQEEASMVEQLQVGAWMRGAASASLLIWCCCVHCHCDSTCKSSWCGVQGLVLLRHRWALGAAPPAGSLQCAGL